MHVRLSTVCPSNTYAAAAGAVGACVACPTGSTSPVGATACTCSGGYSTSGSGATLTCTSAWSACGMRLTRRSVPGTDIRLGVRARLCDQSGRLRGGHLQRLRQLLLRYMAGQPTRIHARSARLARLAHLLLTFLCVPALSLVQSAVPTPSAWRPRRRARPARPAAPALRARRRAHAMLDATGPDPASRFRARVRVAPHLPLLH